MYIYFVYLWIIQYVVQLDPPCLLRLSHLGKCRVLGWVRRSRFCFVQILYEVRKQEFSYSVGFIDGFDIKVKKV